jgi:hypothetical protein
MLISYKTKHGEVSLNVPPDSFFHTVDKKFTVFMEMFDQFDEVVIEPIKHTRMLEEECLALRQQLEEKGKKK